MLVHKRSDIAADAELLRNHVAIEMTDAEFDEGKRCAASYQEDIRVATRQSTSH